MGLTAMTASYRYFLIVAIGYLASLGAYPRLPEPYRLLITVVLPTTAALIYVLLRVVWARDLIRDGDDTFEPTYGAILFAVGLFVITIHLMVLATLAGIPAQRPWLVRGTMVILGLLLIRIGDLLPRTRPNLVFGIRTPRTLADRQLWMQIHRVAGYVAVGLGAVLVVSGAFLSQPRMGNVLVTAAFIAAGVLVVSYTRYAHA